MKLRWAIGLVTLAMGACEVNVGTCTERNDAGRCVFFDEPEPFDGGQRGDAGLGDAAVGMDGASDEGGLVLDATTDAAPVVPDAAPGAPVVSIEQFCRQMLATAVSWRDLFDSEACNCPREPSPDAAASAKLRSDFLALVLAYSEMSEEQCINARKASIDGTNATGKKLVRYEGTKAAACAERFRSQFAGAPTSCPVDLDQSEATIGHGAQTLVQLPECREAFVGLGVENQPCTDQLDCRQGLRCIASADGASASCQSARTVLGNASSSCRRNTDCEDGAVCSGSRANGYRCIFNPETAAKHGALEHGLKDIGGECSFSLECRSGLLCGGTNKCEAPPAPQDRISVCGI